MRDYGGALSANGGEYQQPDRLCHLWRTRGEFHVQLTSTVSHAQPNGNPKNWHSYTAACWYKIRNR